MASVNTPTAAHAVKLKFVMLFSHPLGAPVRSTSYIDEPDSPVRDYNSTSLSPEPSSHRSLRVCRIPQTNNTASTGAALSQSYLNLIDDLASYDHHTEPAEHSDEGSILFSAGAGSLMERELELEPEVKQEVGSVGLVTNAKEEKLHVLGNGHSKGRVRPPDIVLESLPSQSSAVPRPRAAPLGLGRQGDTSGMNCLGNNLQQEEAANGGSKVKQGHSRTRQRNVHCQETEV
jgi:hypothetical protein